jgi:hypothetical protein
MKRAKSLVFLALIAVAIFAPKAALANKTTAKANKIALEQLLVIQTDDRFYTQFPRDSMKMDPLTGMPFARNVREEVSAAFITNWMLRNSHHSKLLNFTVAAFPVLERSIVGAGLHFWKTPVH